MQGSNLFRWRSGAGWLVLSGGGSYREGETEAVDMASLTRSAADGALILISAASESFDEAEHFLGYLGELGGRSGYILDIISEDDESLRTQLSEAGIIVIGNGPHRARLFDSMHGAAIEGVAQAHTQGALIMGIGIGADLFGAWVVSLPDEQPRMPGFTWLANAAVLGGTAAETDKRRLQSLLHAIPTAYGLNVRPGSALTLGPEGQVELWGKQQISISLGQAYTILD